MATVLGIYSNILEKKSSLYHHLKIEKTVKAKEFFFFPTSNTIYSQYKYVLPVHFLGTRGTSSAKEHWFLSCP